MAGDVGAYLDRIGFSGPTDAGVESLEGIVRAHVEAVPFENLDVQLGRRVDLTAEAAFDKIVTRRRGGWCYEQNGLLGWALGELGFAVRRVSAGVLRDRQGDGQLGTHLALIVEDHLVDVGFGGSLAAPLPLREIRREDPPYTVALTRVADGFWRFSEWTGDGEPFTFDFLARAADEAELQRQCERQQADPESVFVRHLVVQKRDGAAHRTLRGTVLSEMTAAGTESRELSGPDDLVSTLESFGLEVPEAASLWPRLAPAPAQ